MAASVAALACAACLATCHDAMALRVRVRARGALTAEAYRTGQSVVVRGKLLDARGRPVRDASISVELRPFDESLAFDADDLAKAAASSSHGNFEARFPLPETLRNLTQWRIAAQFSGNTEVARAAISRKVDIEKPQARLELEIKPAMLTTDVAALEIAVFASVLDVPLTGRSVKVRVDGRPLALLQTGGDGWAVHEAPTAALMPQGQRQLRFELEETDEHNAAVAEATVEVQAATLVSLREGTATSAKPCEADQVCVVGVVEALDPGRGAATVADAAVTLHANKVRLLTTTTDAQGRYAVRLSASRLRRLFGTGDIGLVAEAAMPSAYSEPGWSKVLVMRAPVPTSISQWLYFVVLALIAAGLLWRRWRDRSLELGLAKELADVSAGLPTQSVRRVGSGGLHARDIRGVVLHGETGRPLPATLQLIRPPDEVPERTMPLEHGRFHLTLVDDGPARLRVLADEHQPLEIALEVPHDGTFDGCELLPRSHRAVVRSRFAEVVGEATGRDVDWDRETPQIAEPRWMRAARRGHAAIRSAVSAVESALYGKRASEAVVQQAHEQLDAAKDQAAR